MSQSGSRLGTVIESMKGAAPGDGLEALFAGRVAADGPHEPEERCADVRLELALGQALGLKVVNVEDVVRAGRFTHRLKRRAGGPAGVRDA